MRTSIKASWIVGHEAGHHRLIRDGVVVYEGNRIIHVGKTFDGPVDSTIDATDKLVAPGFIDTHVHTGHRATHRLITDTGRPMYFGQPFLEISVPREGAVVKGDPRYLKHGDAGSEAAFALNAIFRIGSRRRAVLPIDPQAVDYDAIHGFMDGRGGAWGARREVVTRASYVAQQLAEAIADNCAPRGPIALSGSFDEFDLVVEARYAGELLELPERQPTPDEIHDSEDGVRLLAGYLLRNNADRAAATRRGDMCVVLFHFHH